MASKEELKAEILKLDSAATFAEDVTHAALTEQLKALNAKTETQANADLDNANTPKDDEDDAPEAKKGTYSVAKGKALTTLAGIKSDGDEIKAKDLSGGLDAIKAFVKSGHVVKN